MKEPEMDAIVEGIKDSMKKRKEEKAKVAAQKKQSK